MDVDSMPGALRLVVLAGLAAVLTCSGCGGKRPGADAADPAPRIYVADWANHRIVRMDDMRGRNWTALGEKGHGERQFQFPVGIFVDAAGHIYVTEQRHHHLIRMDDLYGANWTTFARRGSEGDAVNK